MYKAMDDIFESETKKGKGAKLGAVEDKKKGQE